MRKAPPRFRAEQPQHRREPPQRPVHANGRLQLRFRPGHIRWICSPFANFGRNHGNTHTTLDQPIGRMPAAFALADYRQPLRTAPHGTPERHLDAHAGRWRPAADALRHLGGPQRLEPANRLEYGTQGALSRTKIDDSAIRDTTVDVNGKYSQLLADRHSMSLGWEMQQGRRSDRRTTTENGVPTLTDFGDTLEARTLRLAGWAQDE